MSQSLTVKSPYDGAVLGELEFMHGDAIEARVQASLKAFAQRQSFPTQMRRDVLRRAAQLLREQHDDFVLSIAREGGKPWRDAQAEVTRAEEGLELAATYVTTQHGREVAMGQNTASAGRWAFTRREPVGCVLAISAFNHPLNLLVHQVAPALAAGCPVLLKPALKTPLTAQRFVALLAAAGMPPAWCPLLLLKDADTARLASDPRLAFVNFIGSAEVGWQLRSRLAPGVGCALEHGGVAPVVLLADAEPSACIDALVKGAFYHAGQVCVSVQRVFVPKAMADDFSSRLAAAAAKLKVGDPGDPATDVGPLISEEALTRVQSWVDEALALGARLLTGGARVGRQCFAPTVLWDPPPEALVSREEVFGPVVCVYPYDDLQTAIARANGLPYSFQAAVFGKDMTKLLATAEALAATTVLLNDHTAFRVDWMPFGGRQRSGLGVGGIEASLQELTYEKLYVLRSP